jgi:phosphoribosylformimino-5-aminoimidazole carboxamide ribotide isomerase
VEIIPVIDLMGGKVVHAKAGERQTYQAIQSVLTKATDLHSVVADILSFYPFKTMYIADLDAITGRGLDVTQYQRCLAQFPEVTFWLDAGVCNQADCDSFPVSERLVMALGSESLQTLSLLKEARSSVLSLDFKQGRFLGDQRLLEQVGLWPDKVIVMNLDRVGLSQGPDLVLMGALREKKREVSLIAAGGVRLEDITILAELGVEQVLIASLLHQGLLTRECLRIISEPVSIKGGLTE